MTNSNNTKKMGTLEFQSYKEFEVAEDFFLKQGYYINYTLFSNEKRYLMTIYKVLDD